MYSKLSDILQTLLKSTVHLYIIITKTLYIYITGLTKPS